jgi:hypothetical protein
MAEFLHNLHWIPSTAKKPKKQKPTKQKNHKAPTAKDLKHVLGEHII